MVDVISLSLSQDEYLTLLEEGIDNSTGYKRQECIEALFEYTNILDQRQDNHE